MSLEDNSSFDRYTNESPNGGGVSAQTIDTGVGTFMIGAICLLVWIMFCGGRGKK